MTEQKKVLVINPNSNDSVTAGLRESLAGFSNRADIECCTLAKGPFGIESDHDIARVIPLLTAKISSSPDYDAYVIACYSDPGLRECRASFAKPVFGMQQSAVETAVSAGGRFGVLALSEESIQRHLAYIRKLGYADRLAGELPLDVTVDEAANDSRTFDRILAQGRRLIDEFGAGTLILGCAGMASYRESAERELAVAVIEPAQAALNLAIGKGQSRGL